MGKFQSNEIDFTAVGLPTAGSYIFGFDVNNAGALSKMDSIGTVTNLENVGGGESLAVTLGLGNETGANNILVQHGQSIGNVVSVNSQQNMTFNEHELELVSQGLLNSRSTSIAMKSDTAAEITMLATDSVSNVSVNIAMNTATLGGLLGFIVSDSGAGEILSSVMTPSSWSITATAPSFAGLTYFADYSANYTNRSLVDKEYVDNLGGAGSLADTLAVGNSVGAGALGYIQTSVPDLAISINDRWLVDSAGNVMIDWQNKTLNDATEILNWGTGQVFDTAEVLTIDWNLRELYNSTGVVTVNYEQF